MDGRLWSCGWNEHGNLGRIVVVDDVDGGIPGKEVGVGSYDSAYDWVPVMRRKQQGHTMDHSTVPHAPSSPDRLTTTTTAATITATNTNTATATATTTARNSGFLSEYDNINMTLKPSHGSNYEQVVLQVVWEGALSCGGGHCLCLTCDDNDDHDYDHP